MPDTTKIVARIGRTGTKLHPATAEKVGPGRYRNLMFACHCGDTNNGWAAIKASVVAEGWEQRTCGKPAGGAS